MSAFICPVCGGTLIADDMKYVCENSHSYDRSKYGYVNLLMSQKSSAKRHGDDKAMIVSRRNFLEQGYYNPLCDKIAQLAVKYGVSGMTLLDVGCGEGYYTHRISDTLSGEGIDASCAGIDISKDALRYAARRRNIELAVASIFNIPVKSDSCFEIINVFAPYCAAEFSRILKDDGVIIRAFALERHLWELKSVLYDNIYENEIESYELEGFELCEKHELKYNISLKNSADIENLFKMTPYYYKTAPDAQQKLLGLSQLDTRIEFCIAVYKK